MISTGYKPVKSKVLVIDDSASNTSMYHNVSALIEELNMRDITVSHATSLDDGIATASSDASIHGVFLNWELQNGTDEHYAARLILDELSNRHANIPVFLMATHSDKVTTIDESVMKKTTEFVWMLQDTADFIAGRMIAAVKRYRDQLLPPFAAALLSTLSVKSTHGLRLVTKVVLRLLNCQSVEHFLTSMGKTCSVPIWA